MMTIFNRCFDALEKSAGFMEGLKDLALTEVAGTKPWVIGRKKPLTDTLKATGKLVAGARGPAVHGVGGAAKSGVRRAVGGGPRVYDVSALANQMGIK